MRTLDELDSTLYHVSSDFINDLRELNGDIMILGAGGKMGPSLARLARLAIDKAGLSKKIIAVSRFSNKDAEDEMNRYGIETISADLMDDTALANLPEIENVLYMAGTKFGTTGNEAYTWAMNTYLPGRIASKFRKSKIVVFSTGNVYPLMQVTSDGPTEVDAVGPVGEYAQSCLGRERIFEHFSNVYKTPILIYRLNYAIDLRYGVLLEIAKSVRAGKPIDLTMGFVNVIWQGDANEVAIRCLNHCTYPPQKLNVTGTQKLAVKGIAEQFGKHFNIEPVFIGQPVTTALLSNAGKMEKMFPGKRVSLDEMISRTGEWLTQDGALLNKPTHFQERGGKF
ncbi:MAG: epimerase [Chryseolinea sp.]